MADAPLKNLRSKQKSQLGPYRERLAGRTLIGFGIFLERQWPMRSDRAASPAGEAVRKEELMRSKRRHHRIGDRIHVMSTLKS